MPNRAYGFAALLAVMAVSIVFGMILGGRFNTPQVVFAAADSQSFRLAPAVGGNSPVTDFADVVATRLPAVVSVTSTARDGEDNPSSNPLLDDPFFRRYWFFGEPEKEEEEGEEEDRQRPPQQRRVGSGSGFIISPDGYVITNNHVIEQFEKIEVTMTDGESFEAKLVGADPSIDLALLKVDPDGRELPTLPLGDSDTLRVGAWVIAIGNPHEFDQTVTVGVVSGKERRVPLPSTDSGVVSFIQTDAAINLGNSGGPLLDAKGNVVGINTAIRRQNFAEGIGFALPINAARSVMEQLRETGEVRRGWIGIRMNDAGIDETARNYYNLPDTKGVLVTWVDPSGPASDAGLKAGDVIREVDRDPVDDNLDMISKISSRRPGEKVDLLVFRGGRNMNVALRLGDRMRGLEAEDGRSRPQVMPGSDDEPDEAEGLGLTVENLQNRTRERLSLDGDQRGVLITDVEFKSEADRKGLQPTMVVTAINDKPIENVVEWEATVRKLPSGSPVKIDVLAPGGEQSFYFFLRAP